MTKKELIEREELDEFRFMNGYDKFYENIYSRAQKTLMKDQMEERLNNQIRLTRIEKINIEKDFVKFI